MTKAPKLKPCPFCGGDATWIAAGCDVPQTFVVHCSDYDCGVGTDGQESFEAVKKYGIPAPTYTPNW